MKEFLFKFFCFLFPFVFITIAFQCFYEIYPYKSIDIFKSQADLKFERKIDSINVVFLGDSFGYYGINPENSVCRSRYFNYSFPSEPVFNTYFKLKYLLNINGNVIKKIYLNANSTMFISKSRNGYNFKVNDRRYFDKYFIDFVKYSSFKDIISYLFNGIHICRLGVEVFHKDVTRETQNNYGSGIRSYAINDIEPKYVNYFINERRDVCIIITPMF